MSETWLPVVGHEDRYDVSDLGRVRSKDGKIAGQHLNAQGYAFCRLSGSRKEVRVHRLVAEAFIPNPNAKPFVNHIDNDRANNVATNLEWCTQLENLRHAEKQGRMQRDYWVGKRSPSAVLSDTQIREIRTLYATGEWSWLTLGRKFGICKRSIGRIINRESYSDV